MASWSQSTYPILVTTPLGENKVLLKSIRGEEQVSQPFEYNLELISTDNALDFASIVGQGATVSMLLENGQTAYRHGIVTRFTQAGKDARFTTYFAQMRPWLWMLTLVSDCRIFQNMTAPDIIKQVFGDNGFTDFRDALTGSYNPREYCVQYMENSFQFVSRLMEEEGIFYFFEHASGKHTLVLADDPSGYGDCAYSTVNVRGTEAKWADEESIDECSLEQCVTTGQYKSDDYNFETPATDLVATAGTEGPLIYEYPAGWTTKDNVDAKTRRSQESLEAPKKLLRGTGACRAFVPGAKFTLAGHSRTDVNAEYALYRVAFHTDQSTVYSNSFEALPSATVFRPARSTPRPRVYGVQTATVVGKAGEEIWTDKYGRIRVHFHWDQLGKKDENDSCWMRVSQGWAGKQWGAWFLPRIGQEVIVSFLEGDPDRPVVTGCLYNGDQTVPYALPGEQTKSTVKSNSSKGGGGFNEIRFEDKKDSEEIYLHAQKDHNVEVLNNQTITVAKNRKATIQEEHETLIVEKGNRTVQVNTGNETHEVKGTRSVTVTGNETHTDKADYTINVSGNYTLKVTGNISIEASGSVSIKSGTSFANEAGTSFSSKAGTSLANEAGTSLTNKAGTTMENNAAVTLTNKAGASQTVDGGGMLTLKGGMVAIN